MRWQDNAKCKGMDVSNFFDTYEKNKEHQLKIHALCSACPVKKECYDYAKSNKLEGGVFGGVYIPQNGKKPKKKVSG